MVERKKPNISLQCHKCKKDIPFLHPHIMIERRDDEENLICEECYEKLCLEKKSLDK